MPIYIQSQLPQLDWYHYFNLFGRLPPQYKRVGEIVGVEEGFLARAIRGRIPTRTEEQRRKLAVHQRFYSALALLELVNEIPLRTVSRRYNINKGLLQSLQGSSSTFAGMVTKFCEKLGWRSLELLIDQFQNRLSFGITRELCDLVRISLLNGARARLLYNSGYHTVNAVAMASPSEVAKLLEHFAPFETCKNLQGESERELESKKRVRSFWVTGKDGMTEAEAALEIIDEAKELVRKDLISMGVEITKIEFLSDNSKTKVKIKETITERIRTMSKENPLPNDESQNKPKPECKHEIDNLPESNCVIKESSLSVEGIPAGQGAPEEASHYGHNPMAVNEKVLEHEIEPNVASNKLMPSNQESIRKHNSASEIFKKLQINADHVSSDSGEFAENCAREEANLRDSRDSKVCGQQVTNKKPVCERNKYVNLDNGQKPLNDRQNEASSVVYNDAIQSSNLLENQDLCLILERFDNQSNKAVKRSSCSGDRSMPNKYVHHSDKEKKPECVIKAGYDLSQGMTEALCFDECFDSSNENSVEEINGSLILIDSKEDISVCDADLDKDITPELYSETLWGDIEIESTGKPFLGRSSSENAAIDGAGHVLNTNSKNKMFDSEAVLTKVKGRCETGIVNFAFVENDNAKAANSIACKLNAETANSRQVVKDSVHENMSNSSTDMFEDSMEDGSALNSGNLSGNSFHLKLSESIGEPESPDVLDACLERYEDENLGGCASENYETSREEKLVLSSKATQDSEPSDNNSKRYSNSEGDCHRNQEIDQENQCHFSKVDKKSELQEIDWDFILSGSDSFANALCNIGIGKDSQNARVIETEKNLGKWNCGPALKVVENTEDFEICSEENFYKETIIELEPLREKTRDKMNFNSNHNWKGKRKTDETECAGGMKRRSSERIAEKMFQVGETEEFSIVDIAMDRDIFSRFIEYWRKKDTFSFSVARLSKTDIDAQEGSHSVMDVSGVAVCLGGSTSFFIDFLQHKKRGISGSEEVDEILKRTIDMLTVELNSSRKIVFDAKEHYKVFNESLGVEFKGELHDPKVAAWLLDPNSKEMTLQELALRHLPQKYGDLVNSMYRIGISIFI